LSAVLETPSQTAIRAGSRRLRPHQSRSEVHVPLAVPDVTQSFLRRIAQLEVVKHPMAKRAFVLLPRRWVVERSFAWAARFRRLVRDYERLDTTLKGFHYLAFACFMIANMFKQLA
jgi:hypothetical protein